jgi:hypothetical protein
MQINITDKNIYASVHNLDRQRLFSNIYEGIHGLSSLLGVHDQLVTPKRDISNYPQVRLWELNIMFLFSHIVNSYERWFKEYANKNITLYNSTINFKNIEKITLLLDHHNYKYIKEYPDWVTDEVIQVHRSHLIQKNPDFYKSKWPDVPDNLKMRYDWRA